MTDFFIYGMTIGNLLALCALGYMVQSMWDADGKLQDRMVEVIRELRSRVESLESQATRIPEEPPK